MSAIKFTSLLHLSDEDMSKLKRPTRGRGLNDEIRHKVFVGLAILEQRYPELTYA